MKRMSPVLLLLALWPSAARSFCGFYVASGDARLFNHASQVALVRDEDRTVLTMANDFRGEPKEFAIVVPVPTVLEQSQVHVGEKAVIDHLDAYSAPRLVEYLDPDPCPAPVDNLKDGEFGNALAVKQIGQISVRGGRGESVTIEARYTVGEYDILILSARESDGLERWLREHGYRVPAGASRVLAGYIKQGMKFFVARVNLKEQLKLGFTYLRPIQVAYESPRFMLPIRLGMVNADGPQELFVYALTRRGRVETVNYRTAKLASDRDVPEFVKAEFPDFYRATFAAQVERDGMQAVYTEYAWDAGWCDPCASGPLTGDELRSLGCYWVGDAPGASRAGLSPFVTRLHVRYALPRGSPVPGDRRPRQLPGPVRDPPRVEGHGRLRGGPRLPGGARRAAREGGGQSGRAHGLESRQDPRKDGGRRGLEPPRGPDEVVGPDLEGLTARPRHVEAT